MLILILLNNKGFIADSLQTDAYLKRAEPIIKGRMMYASRRLYDIIVDIYGSDEGGNVVAEMITAFLQW